MLSVKIICQMSYLHYTASKITNCPYHPKAASAAFLFCKDVLTSTEDGK